MTLDMDKFSPMIVLGMVDVAVADGDAWESSAGIDEKRAVADNKAVLLDSSKASPDGDAFVVMRL